MSKNNIKSSNEKSESEPVLLDKETYEVLKEISEENDTTVIEEIFNAFSNYYEDVSEDDLEDIDILKENDKTHITLSDTLYGLLETEATENASEVSDILSLIINEYLSEDDEGEEQDEEEDEE